jgi:CDGSH-type Zn-finger protein
VCNYIIFALLPGGDLPLNSTRIKKKVMAATKITVNSNGSLKIEGDFEIVDKTGTPYDLGGRDVVSICRCGLSKNKPFCDASHKGHFEHEAIAFALPPKKVN